MTTEERGGGSPGSIFDLSTAVEPPLTFEVDGQPYELRTVSHLNVLEEAKLRRLFRREQVLDRQLAQLKPTDEAAMQRIGEQLRGLRIELITMMTSLPAETAERLPTLGQQKLIRAIGKEASELRGRGLEDEEDAESEE